VTQEKMRSEDVTAHETSTSLLEAVPAELSAGSDIALKVRVSCPSACDLRGKVVKIVTPEAVVKEIVVELTEFDGMASETPAFIVKAPTKPGEYPWRATFPPQETEGLLHRESSAPVSFSVRAHTISMAVWDVPSPVVMGKEFSIKVGAKCSAGCSLAGKRVEIYGQEDSMVATGTLGSLPWSVAGTLYWTSVKIQAPAKEGYYTWEVRFPEPELRVPHEESSFKFSFGTARPPKHTVTVNVVDNRNGLPLIKADIRLRPLKVVTDEAEAAPADVPSPAYKAATDENGLATVRVPEGTYELFVTMDDYLPFEHRIAAHADVGIKVELTYWKIVEY
jgi:hypothetical protein